MSTPPEQRPAARKKTEKKSLTSTIGIDTVVHRQLASKAKELKVTKGEYASAAIAYFTKSGIDPREEHLLDGPLTRSKISEGVANVRAHNADIGNRLYALTRSFEKTIYQFMQQQEHNMNLYLEGIEGNIMRRLVSMEDNLLRPLLERVLRGSQDAYITRGVATRVHLELLKEPTLWSAQNAKYTEERERVLVEMLREIMKTHETLPAKSTRRPAATPVPPKPVAPAPAATPPKP